MKEKEQAPQGIFGKIDSVTEKVENCIMSIGLLLIPRRAASLIKKTEQVRCFDPAHNLQADAWKMDYRLYYDVVLKNGLAGGIFAYTF